MKLSTIVDDICKQKEIKITDLKYNSNLQGVVKLYLLAEIHDRIGEVGAILEDGTITITKVP